MKDNRILKLLVYAVIAITVAFICMAILFALAFQRFNSSLQDLNHKADVVSAIEQLNNTDSGIVQAINNIKIIKGDTGSMGAAGAAGTMGATGATGLQGSVGATGASGAAGCQFEVDGLGDYRCVPGDDFVPLGL